MDLAQFLDLGQADVGSAGAKAAELARLRRAGFPVPDGIVLPAGVAADDAHVIASFAAEAARRFPGPVAVRSSGTREDHATSAHAGEGRTELGPEGESEITAAVQRCLRASTGRIGEVAILVMPLLTPTHAGVAFSADPLTGDRDVVRISAVAGLAEGLVSGEATGIELTVRGGEVSGDPEDLVPADAIAVAELAQQVEHHLGAPQDIEWAIEDGRLWLLQARPITVLPVRPELPEGNNWQKDTAHYPEPLTAFGWSAMHSCGDAIASVFDEVGLLIRGLEERCVGGEVYSRALPAFGSADSASPPPPAPVLGLAARIVPELRRRTATAARILATGQIDRWEQDWYRHVRAGLVTEEEQIGSVDLTTITDRELAEHHDRCLDFLQRGMQVHFRLLMPYVHGVYALHRLVNDELGWQDSRIATMLAGHSPATREPAVALAALRRAIVATPGADEALAARPDDPVGALAEVDRDLAERVQQWMDQHGWAAVNYDAGLPVIAERPTTVTGLLRARLDTGDEEARTAADHVADEARSALPAGRREDFDTTLARARRVAPLREDNTIIAGDRPLGLFRRWMLEATRRLVDRGVLGSVADGPHLTHDELRAALVGSLGPAEAAATVQRRRGEQAWVRAHPGPAFIGKQSSPPDTARLPAPLRAVNEPILWMVGHEYPVPPTEVDEDGDVVAVGVPASAGVAEGPARVIRSHDDMHRLQAGDVLVCQVTSPAWAAVFPLASAVVGDGGGVLSHAAIAAREHGIPAVLGTGSGTVTIADGQPIRVDGTTGTVFAC